MAVPSEMPEATSQRELQNGGIERITDQMETPSLDDRSYRVIRLPNQLEVLLVHDPETDKASAAMDVNVGAFSDADDMPGMAHAVEHLLFMGTKKYPVENAYSAYLSAHNGNSNAYTASTSTNYYFEIAAVAGDSDEEVPPFYGAMDRFAQFFIEPLFLSNTLDRELKAVDSENKKNLQSDTWRLHQLDKSLSNPEHPYHHFSTGNFETLKTIPEARGVDVRAEFIKFHETHYSANRMKLVVLGRESLDTLEQWAAELFSDIKNKDLPQQRWESQKPWRDSDLGMQYFAKPVMDSRLLDLYFPFMDEEMMYETNPSRYLSHLIGHEGPGSIMAYIKAKGWSNGLSAGAYSTCPGSPGMFNCQIRLTEEGLKNYKDIVKVFFQYIALLKESPPEEWIFEEQKGLADIDFKFRQKTPASSFTSHISGVMQKPLPREWLISGGSKLRKFDGKLIAQGLSDFTPEKFRMSVVSQTVPGKWDQKEKWYGTEYTYEKIPADFIEELKQAVSASAPDRLPELHLPQKNQFIPTKLDVEQKDIKEPAVAPVLIRNDDLFRLWYKKDDTFWVPKANLYINCVIPLAASSAENTLKSRLYDGLVQDALVEYSYDAELAGLEYSMSSGSQGLSIEVSGYNDKLAVLLEKVLVTMRDLVVKPDRFEIIKERTARGMKNWGFQQPYNQVGTFTRWLTAEKAFTNDELLADLPHITAEDIQAFYPQLLNQMHIETFVHGNIYKEDALKLADLVKTVLKPRALPLAQRPIRRSMLYLPGTNYLHNRTLPDPNNVNHCIEYLLHVGDRSDRPLRTKLLLLDQLLKEKCFDELRTKQQLGYVVFSGTRPTATTIGYHFIVQSERTPAYLESRIEAFLKDSLATITDMPEAEFEGHKRALINKKLEKMKNLDQESGRHWAHIENEYYDFELARLDAESVKPISKSDMLDFYNHYIAPSSPHRATLAVHMHAQTSTLPPWTPETISSALSEVIAAIPATPQPKAFRKRLESQSTAAAVRSHMEEDLKIPADKLDAMYDQAVQKLHIVPDKVGPGAERYIIEDVREFKSRLQVSSGPQPFRDLSEFLEGDSKL